MGNKVNMDPISSHARNSLLLRLIIAGRNRIELQAVLVAVVLGWAPSQKAAGENANSLPIGLPEHDGLTPT